MSDRFIRIWLCINAAIVVGYIAYLFYIGLHI